MDKIQNSVDSLIPAAMSIPLFAKTVLLLSLGLILVAVLGRLFFGKKSVLSRSVSSAIGIFFIYVITIVIYSLGVNLQFMLAPLPFVSIHGDYLVLQIYEKMNYTAICHQILSMIILAFLANLADGWLPKSKNLFAWFFFRCLSVVIAMVMHLMANALLNILLPEGLLLWAPVVLLGLLVLMMAVGALKIVVGALLSTVNPLIGALYTFFFANAIGKQLSKSVLTTAILAGVVWLLHYLGIPAVYIAVSALTGYIPLLLLLLGLWYLVGHIF